MLHLNELIAKIQSQMCIMPRAGESKVVVRTHVPGTIGGSSYVEVKTADLGIDWDDGKYILTPAEPLVLFSCTREKELLGKLVDAYEKLPGGRYYKARDIQNWLVDDLQPAIQEIRMHLGRKPR